MTQMDEMIEQIWIGATSEALGANKPGMKIWTLIRRSPYWPAACGVAAPFEA